MTFYSEQPIKRIRKARPCDGCGSTMEVGTEALRCVGKQDDFWSATYHPECREAEIKLNDLHDVRVGDDWMPLSDIDWEEYLWLIESFPVVADRMNITIARYEEAKERYGRLWFRS